MIRSLKYFWAGPYTCIGLILGGIASLLGSHIRTHSGNVEIAGGIFGGMARLPGCMQFGAITLGHVILAADLETLDQLRAHEQVHVRQYERWGLVFVPAYLLAGLWTILRGGHPYRDNPFEREAQLHNCA
jgi:hypothetical protein